MIEGLQELVRHKALVHPLVQAPQAKALVVAIEAEPSVDKVVELIAPLAVAAAPAWGGRAGGRPSGGGRRR